MIPPLIPMLYVFTLPESPRFLLEAAIKASRDNKKKEKYEAGFTSLMELNKSPLLASREFFWIYHSIKEETGAQHSQPSWLHTVKGLWTEGRTRRALIASTITVFLQQFCGVNVMAYYSTSILFKAWKQKEIVEPVDGPTAFIVSSWVHE